MSILIYTFIWLPLRWMYHNNNNNDLNSENKNHCSTRINCVSDWPQKAMHIHNSLNLLYLMYFLFLLDINSWDNCMLIVCNVSILAICKPKWKYFERGGSWRYTDEFAKKRCINHFWMKCMHTFTKMIWIWRRQWVANIATSFFLFNFYLIHLECVCMFVCLKIYWLSNLSIECV